MQYPEITKKTFKVRGRFAAAARNYRLGGPRTRSPTYRRQRQRRAVNARKRSPALTGCYFLNALRPPTKVYGDRPNAHPCAHLGSPLGMPESHPFYKEGIDESMSIDDCKALHFSARRRSRSRHHECRDTVLASMKCRCFPRRLFNGSFALCSRTPRLPGYLIKCIAT